MSWIFGQLSVRFILELELLEANASVSKLSSMPMLVLPLLSPKMLVPPLVSVSNGVWMQKIQLLGQMPISVLKLDVILTQEHVEI